MQEICYATQRLRTSALETHLHLLLIPARLHLLTACSVWTHQLMNRLKSELFWLDHVSIAPPPGSQAGPFPFKPQGAWLSFTYLFTSPGPVLLGLPSTMRGKEKNGFLIPGPLMCSFEAARSSPTSWGWRLVLGTTKGWNSFRQTGRSKHGCASHAWSLFRGRTFKGYRRVTGPTLVQRADLGRVSQKSSRAAVMAEEDRPQPLPSEMTLGSRGP